VRTVAAVEVFEKNVKTRTPGLGSVLIKQEAVCSTNVVPSRSASPTHTSNKALRIDREGRGSGRGGLKGSLLGQVRFEACWLQRKDLSQDQPST
jgi:hypothetical protein